MEKYLVSIPEAYESCSFGRSTLYELIADGQIETVKVGRRTLVVAESLQTFVDGLRANGSKAEVEPEAAAVPAGPTQEASPPRRRRPRQVEPQPAA